MVSSIPSAISSLSKCMGKRASRQQIPSLQERLLTSPASARPPARGEVAASAIMAASRRAAGAASGRPAAAASSSAHSGGRACSRARTSSPVTPSPCHCSHGHVHANGLVHMTLDQVHRQAHNAHCTTIPPPKSSPSTQKKSPCNTSFSQHTHAHPSCPSPTSTQCIVLQKM